MLQPIWNSSSDQDKTREDTTESNSNNARSSNDERKVESEEVTMFPSLEETKHIKSHKPGRRSSASSNSLTTTTTTTSTSSNNNNNSKSSVTLGSYLIDNQHSKSNEIIPTNYSKQSYHHHHYNPHHYHYQQHGMNSKEYHNNNNTPTHPNLQKKAVGSLESQQKTKLTTLLAEKYEISSKDKSISFQISMDILLSKLRQYLENRQIGLCFGGMRLVGSGASFIVLENTEREMNDLDFSFYINEGGRFLEILELEEDVLCELLREKKRNRKN